MRSKMRKAMFLLGFAAALNLWADMPYTRGDNLVRNGALKAVKAKWKPDEWGRACIPPNAKYTMIPEENGWKMYFLPNQENMDQVRLVQFNIKTEPGYAYELMYEAKTGPGVSMKRDSFLLGTGVWARFFTLPPLQQWTKCRSIFWIPRDVPEKGVVTLGLQNRSTSPVWYRNVSLRKISIGEKEAAEFAPPVKLLPLTPKDAIVLPDSGKEYLQYVVSGIPDHAYDNYRFEIRLYKNDTDFIQGRVNGKRVELPVSEMPVGISVFQLLVYDKRDRALVATSTLQIERIDKVPEHLADFDKMIPLKTPRGDTIFPIGIYAGLGWNFSLQKLKDCGFNTVHTYGTDSWIVREENMKLLREAEKLGMWVLMGLPPGFQIRESALESMSHWITAYKRYPAILSYYSDEVRMRGTPLELVRKNYQTVKKADPTRLHYMYDKPEYGLGETTDCLMIDISSKNLARVIKLRMGNLPVIHVFGNVDYKNSTASSLDYNQSNFVMPVIWGASGIFYWWMPNLEGGKEGNLEYRKLAPRVLNSFKRFSEIAPALISGETLPDWTKQIQTEGAMEHKLFARQGKVYIFCGVANGSPENGTIRLPIPAGRTLRDVLNDQQLEANNEFLLKLHPGQGRIIEVK